MIRLLCLRTEKESPCRGLECCSQETKYYRVWSTGSENCLNYGMPMDGTATIVIDAVSCALWSR